MDNFKEKIGRYIDICKKNSKLNKTEISEIVELLKVGLAEGDIAVDGAIDILLEIHYAATTEFIKSAFIDFDSEMKSNFVSKFLHSDKIIKNANNFGIARSLVIINSLLQTGGNEEFIHMLLKVNAKKAYGKDGGRKAGEQLTKICLDDTKTKLFLLDYSAWEETELRNLSAWINNAISFTQNQDILGGYYQSLKKYNLPVMKKNEAEKSNIQSVESLTPSASSKNDENVKNSPESNIKQAALKDGLGEESQTGLNKENAKLKKESHEKILSLAGQLQAEADRMVKEKYRQSDEIVDLKSKLEQANKEKEKLLAQISEANSRNEGLRDQLKTNEIRLQDAEKKMLDMSERLEYAYKADKRSDNQELTALKNGLVNQLKIHYEDYRKYAKKERAEYSSYYEGLVGVIEDIFDSLRRKGIVVNNEIEG